MSAWERQLERTLQIDGDASAARAELVRRTLSAPANARLNDREHALVRAMRDDLVARVEDLFRERLLAGLDRGAHAALVAALETPRVRIVEPLLGGALILDGAVDAILRRLDEDRLARRLRALGDPDEILPDLLLTDRDPLVAEAAMLLTVAETRRVDRFDEPRVIAADLMPRARHQLFWTVAAAVSRYLRIHQAMAEADADRLVGDAAAELLAAPLVETADQAAMTLAGLLDTQARLDDRVIADALAGGRIALVVAALSRCAGLPVEHCWMIVASPPGRSLLMLLRAAEMSVESVREVLIAIADDPVGLAQIYDDIRPDEVAETLRRWRIDPAYRAAQRSIGAGSTR